jgi:hypothetical protein
MLISVADYRDTTGDVTTSDVDASAAISRMQSRIESYLDRRLESQPYLEKHYYNAATPVVLKQYPVTAVTSILKDGTAITLDTIVVNGDTGVLFHSNTLTWAKELTIEYTAGYETCPDDIRYVLCDLAKARVDGTLDSFGPQDARALKKETVYGVASVEYFAGSAMSKVEFFPELGPYVSVLERYKRPFEVPSF